MLVTVAVCTWNRALLLDQALAEIHRLRVPSGTGWELVVVDNGCTDETPAVLERWSTRLPLKRVVEPLPGISHARTRALEEARGDLLLFADDDVLVDSNWLAAYVEAAEQRPDAAFFGGPIEPWFPDSPPRWLVRNLSVFAGAFAMRAAPASEILARHADLPFSANLALRRSAYQNRRFDPELGRNRGAWLGGEELRFLEELVAEGHFGVWVGEAQVRHQIPAERQTRRFLWSFYHGKGRTRVRRGDALPPRERLLRSYWKARARCWLARPARGERWARAFKRSATMRGVLDELEVRRRAAGSASPRG